MIHELKIIQPHFDDVVSGKKTFEVRKNDRDFKVGDELILKEYDLESKSYSGESVHMVITYILDDEDYCKSGYVILGMTSIWNMFSKHIEKNCINHNEIKENLHLPTSVDTFDSDFTMEEIVKITDDISKELDKLFDKVE